MTDTSTQNQQLAAQSFAPVMPPALPTTGQLSDYYNQAFAALQPYYQQKLAEAKGDLTEAMRRITYDYQTGMRYNTQDTTLATQRQNEDTQSAMQKLGLTFQGETNQKQDTLNQRGIATVQGANGRAQAAAAGPVSYDANGNPTYQGGQGQAGNELSMLREDQGLRSQAEQRASQRNLQDIGIKSERQTASLGETQKTGTYDTNRQFQQTGEQLGQQQQQQAYGLATDKLNQETQAKQLQQSTDLYNAQMKSLQAGNA